MTEIEQSWCRPLVSIGLPVYNGQETLEEAIVSLRNQSYQNIEIIISDDFSSDASAEIISRHASEDSRVKFFKHGKNLGAVDNFNFVLNKATGLYFFWHGQDDVRHQHYIDKCMLYFRECPNLVYCHTKYVDFIGSTDKKFRNLRSIGFLLDLSIGNRYVSGYSSGIGSTAFYGMYSLEKVRSKLKWENYNGSDMIIFQSVILEGPIAEVPEVLFFYRGKVQVRDKKDHFRFLKRSNKVPVIYLPGVVLFLKSLEIVMRANIGFRTKIYILSKLFYLESVNVMVKIIYAFVSNLVGVSTGNKFLRLINRSEFQPMDVGHKD